MQRPENADGAAATHKEPENDSQAHSSEIKSDEDTWYPGLPDDDLVTIKGIDSFTYEPLPDPARYIRLLRFEKTTSHSALSIKLEVFNIEDAPNYGAISYAWGLEPDQEHPAKALLINDKAAFVWENCHYALFQVRYQLQHDNQDLEWIWVDSVCINQADLIEKEAQVQMMASHIFSGAAWVYACVGPDYDGSRDFLEQIAIRNGIDPYPTWAGTPSSVREERLACSSFITRPYWQRLWIVPEIMVASDVRIVCGLRALSIEVLFHAVRGLRFEPWLDQDSSPCLKVLSTKIFNMRFMLGEDKRLQPFDLTVLYRNFKGWKCSNPRDRFYAFCSLVDWVRYTDRHRPDINYKISLIDLAQIVLLVVFGTQEARSIATFCKNAGPVLKAFEIMPSDLYASETGRPAKDCLIQDTGRGKEPASHLADISRSSWTTIIEGNSGDMMTSPRLAEDTKQPFTMSNVAPRHRTLMKDAIPMGWVCPQATFGDSLVEINALPDPVSHVRPWIVLRRKPGIRSPGFSVIGLAMILKRYTLRPQRGNSIPRGTHIRLTPRDLIALASPSLSESEQYINDVLANPWPTLRDTSTVQSFPEKEI